MPRHASESGVFQVVTSKDEDERMPPRKGGGEPLTAKQIALLQQWIDAGAEWPESGKETAKTVRAEMKVTDADRKHWSFLPLAAVEPPMVKDTAWARTPVDQFIRHAQEAKKISPSAPADARTLVRRIYFDLIGLPPTPEEMTRWSSRIGESRDAVRALVDELLASPHTASAGRGTGSMWRATRTATGWRATTTGPMRIASATSSSAR